MPSSWTTYKGLKLPTPDPVGDAGDALKDNYVVLVDRGLDGTETPGSVVFIGSGPTLDENNSKLFWDSANERLGVGTDTPLKTLHIESNGGGLLMATGGTSGTETFIYFGSGQSSAQDWMRVRFNYNSGDLFFERKDTGAGGWTSVLVLDWQKSHVGFGTASPATRLEVAGTAVGNPASIGGITIEKSSADPTAPAAGKAVLYVLENGASLELKVKFPDGTTTVLASE